VTGDNANGYSAFLEVGVGVDGTSSDLIFANGFEG